MLTALDRQAKIYIPSTVDVGVPATELQATVTDEVMATFTDLFGGATMTQAVGAYRANDGQIVKEAINIVYAFTDTAGMEANRAKVLELAVGVATKMGQESVSVEFDGKLLFVTPSNVASAAA